MINNGEVNLKVETVNYAPLVTAEKFSELTGLSVNAVNSAVHEGRLPSVKRDMARKGRVYINMRALEQFAEEQADKFQDWKFAI